MTENQNTKPPQELIDEYEALADKYEEELMKRSQLVGEIENFQDQLDSAQKELENINNTHKQ